MRDVEVRDLLELTESEIDNPHEKLTQLYLWIYDYAMAGAKGLTFFGTTLLVGLAVVVVQEKSPHIDWFTGIGFAGAVLTMVVGLLRYNSMRNLSKQFIAGHHLLSEISTIRPFLRLYRNEVRGGQPY